MIISPTVQRTRNCPQRRPTSTVRIQREVQQPQGRRLHVAALPVRQAGEVLQGSELQSWLATLEAVKQLGLPDEDAEKCVARAFGWSSQAYWRQEKVEVVPDPDQVGDVVSFLAELGIQGDDLVKVVKAFPEVLGCSVEDRLKGNVRKLESAWRLKGDVLTRALLRSPQVLGYTYDCAGDCVGECNRCWARF